MVCSPASDRQEDSRIQQIRDKAQTDGHLFLVLFESLIDASSSPVRNMASFCPLYQKNAGFAMGRRSLLC